MKDTAYTYSRICQASLRDLIPLFKSAFGATPSLASLSRKHDTSFSGVRDVGMLARAGSGSAAAFYGVFPVHARIQSQTYLVAQSGDTMVHKSHGGKGLFAAAATRTYALAKENGIQGVFGFPSASSYPGFIKRLGWAHDENLYRYLFLVPMLPVSELLWRLPFARALLTRWQAFLLGFFESGNYFEGSLKRSRLDCIDRTEGYWQYKLSQPGVTCLRVRGVLVVVKLEGGLGIGDIDSSDPLEVRNVLWALRAFCVLAGIGTIRTYLSRGTPLDQALSCLSKPTKGLPVGYVDFSEGVSLGGIRFCYLDMDTF